MNVLRTIAKAIYLGAVALSLGATPSVAQDYPSAPIKWLLPYGAGGDTDTVARLLAEDLAKRLGQPVVVENRPGGNSIIALQALMSATPNGYTIMTVPYDSLTVTPYIDPNAKYNIDTDFEYVGAYARFPMLLVTRKDFPANDAREVFDLIRKSDGDLTHTSFGAGSASQIMMAMLVKRLGGKVTPVVYPGAGQAGVDLLGGRVDFHVAGVPAVISHVTSGTLKPIAWMGNDVNPVLPDVPSLADAGVENYEFLNWQGVIAPKGTPADVVAKLSEALQATMSDPGIQKALADRGVDPFYLAPAEFRSFVATQNTKMKAEIESGVLQ